MLQIYKNKKVILVLKTISTRVLYTGCTYIDVVFEYNYIITYDQGIQFDLFLI